MPAEFMLSLGSKSAMAETVISLIDADDAAGRVELQNSSSEVLVSIAFDYPCGYVDIDTGKLNFAPTEDFAASAVGSISKAVFKTSSGQTVFEANVSLKTGDAFVRLDSLVIDEIGQPIRISVGEITY